ncbi:MAG: hypothetical protein V1777_05385 [Candidatus Micrarchaeota archaeon]
MVRLLQNKIFWGAVLFVALFLVFYPRFWDVDYLSTIRTAQWFWQGKFVETNPQYAYYMWQSAQGFFLYPFEIGRTLVSAPLALISWNAPFILGLLFHLLGFWFFFKTLRLLKWDERYSLVYLFFPSVALIADRFYLGEAASIALICGAVFFYLRGQKNDYWLSGIFFGLSVWFRFTNVVVAAAFAVAVFFRHKKQVVPFLTGTIVLGALFCGVTYLILGAPWGYVEPGYVSGSVYQFGFFHVLESIGRYLIFLLAGFEPLTSRGLLIVFPLTLLALFKARVLRLETALSLVFVIVFFSIAMFNTDGRYVLVLFPLLLLGSIPAADALLKKIGEWQPALTKTAVVWTIIVLLLAATTAVFWVQSQKGEARLRVAQTIYSSTPQGALLMDYQGGFTSSFLLETFGDRRLETASIPQLKEKILTPCWVKDNGGLGNIYTSIVELSPRTENSIAGFMKVDPLTTIVRPLSEFLAEQQIKSSQIPCQ